MSNYQTKLETHVIKYVSVNQPRLLKHFEKFATFESSMRNKKIDFEKFLIDEPVNSDFLDREPAYRPLKINYLKKEQDNRALGEEGEKLVMEYERYRLLKAGKQNLADKIEWISKVEGDGTGYDILSKNINGTDRFLEVKTTKLTKEAPIFITRTEMSFAQHQSKNFYLYRVFNFDSTPGMFIKSGQYTEFCTLIPQTFKGFFKS